MKLNAYVMFEGQCDEAFQFYAKCLGGRIAMKMTYGESPCVKTDGAQLAEQDHSHAAGGGRPGAHGVGRAAGAF